MLTNSGPWGTGFAQRHGSDDELQNFQLRCQTLKANHGQSVFHDNINHGYAALFRYGVLASTFRLHLKYDIIFLRIYTLPLDRKAVFRQEERSRNLRVAILQFAHK
ncbi:hypothetical protein EVAR_38632_1 [Eumeta japonica]|uniref:Uncharacterized protein n=1 Tax=Eumeta variegata TaxID=151549 RepID=A0A4C1XXS4_EUMVA|nr:hypothetical protein EVAR_38632_1 [Eumeta japonica]